MSTVLTEDAIYDKFAEIVSRSLRVNRDKVTPEANLIDDLGAESLDLIEITMETESAFNLWLPEKSILETAKEIYGPVELERDGHLTEAGKQLLRRRLPEEDAHLFGGDIAVADLQSYFLTVRSWVRMIYHLTLHTPTTCDCGTAFVAEPGFRLKCPQCGQQIALRSGEDLNREWVRDFYEKEYLAGAPASNAARG